MPFFCLHPKSSAKPQQSHWTPSPPLEMLNKTKHAAPTPSDSGLLTLSPYLFTLGPERAAVLHRGWEGKVTELCPMSALGKSPSECGFFPPQPHTADPSSSRNSQVTWANPIDFFELSANATHREAKVEHAAQCWLLCDGKANQRAPLLGQTRSSSIPSHLVQQPQHCRSGTWVNPHSHTAGLPRLPASLCLAAGMLLGSRRKGGQTKWGRGGRQLMQPALRVRTKLAADRL